MIPEASTCNSVSQSSSSTGEKYEKLAFTFCKAATLVLLTQKYAMIVTAGGATVFYLLAHFHGQRETRCILRKPLISAGFWGVICLAAAYTMFRPMLTR